MKFQKLTIHNIASIEDTVIDFEAKPLVDSEVFLITGKTGSGKSTILDSICLALYATTPRFENTMMQGDTNDGDKILKIDDPRQLMRENTGEAFVTLTFTGRNGRHYEATWSVARARKKADGNLQAKSWTLTDLDTNFTYSKDKEIEAEIATAIGLDFNQFCRTTMLAQGEFTRFLNSKDEDKADILEKITGMDIYSKIGKKINDITKAKHDDYDEAEKSIKSVKILSDEQIDEKNKEIENINILVDKKKSLKDNEIKKRDWLTKNDELTKDVNDAAEKLRKDNFLIESDDYKQKTDFVKNWNETVEVRGWLAEANKASTTIERQNIVIQQLERNFASLLGGHQTAIEKTQKIGQQISDIDTFLSSEKEKESIYKNVQTIVGNLKTIVEGQNKIAELEKGIEITQKDLENKLIPAFEDIKKNEAKAKEELGELENEVKDKEDSVEKLQLPELRKQFGDIKDLIRNILSARESVEKLSDEKKRMEDLKGNLLKRFEEIKTNEGLSESMVKPIEDSKQKMDNTKKELDKQIDTVNKFATLLRSKLHVGDICPVCRQKIDTEFPHEDVLSEFVNDLKEKFEKAEKEYTVWVENKNKLDAKIDSESKSYERDKTFFDKDKSVVIAEKKALDACAKCGIDSLTDSTPADLESKHNEAIKERDEIDGKITEGEKKEKVLKELRETLELKRKQVDKLGERIKNAEKYISDKKGEIDKANGIINSKKDDICKAEENVKDVVSSVTWSTDWLVSPKEFASELTSAAEEYDKKVSDKRTLVESQDKAKTSCENVGKVIDQTLLTYPNWRTTKPITTANTTNLLECANEINTAVTQATTQLKSAQNDFYENKTKVDDFLKKQIYIDENTLIRLNAISRESKDAVENEVNKGREAVIQSTTLLKKANEILDEHQKTKPVLDENDTIINIGQRIEDIDNEVSTISERRGVIKKELDDEKENKSQLKAKIAERDKKKDIYDKWFRLNSLFGDGTGKTFRKIAQSYVLSSLIRSANTYMKTLTDRYTLKVTPGTFVISIEDAYQGFVSRAASTISGGESFLVSLSLALALSDIGQTLSVDTLFIDEGFGTLSGEPLQNAVNTLRSLHTKVGRHVGIISHVEELQERIPVQIQVNQEGNCSSSRIRIVPE